MTVLADFPLSEQQRDALDELDAKHPATTFLIVAKYEHSRSVLIEHEDLVGSGLLLLTANGKLHEAPPVLP
jgi:hypothetical protein